MKNGRELTDLENERLLEVIKSIPTEIGQFYVKAFQSYVFNKVLQWRIKYYGKDVLEGDSIFVDNGSNDVNEDGTMKTRIGGEEKEKEKEINRRIEIKTVTREEKEMVQLDQVVIPLCG